VLSVTSRKVSIVPLKCITICPESDIVVGTHNPAKTVANSTPTGPPQAMNILFGSCRPGEKNSSESHTSGSSKGMLFGFNWLKDIKAAYINFSLVMLRIL
jgi:hypothetical protein